MYGPSQLGWNFSFARLAVFFMTLLQTNSPGRNVSGFTRQLCKFASFYGYDIMRTAAASRSSSVVSKSLAMAATLASSGIFAHTVGIPIFEGMMGSILYVRANSDTLVGFRQVVR